MVYQVLARKWRPHQFQDIVGQSHVVRALQNALNQQYLHHAYLFTGTRGIGKTTLARLIVKCLSCETGITANPCDTCSACQEIDGGCYPDLFEVDAASRTKVEDTRELLDNVLYAPSRGRFKIYLIDEVHMLSNHSFNALLKTLEEPPPHVKFLLATTDHQKLPPTILSRCLQFHLKPLLPAQIATQLQHILTEEKIIYENEATALLAHAVEGSLRDALSLLDQSIAYGNGTVNTNDVKEMLGVIESPILYNILSALAEKNGNRLFTHITQLANNGADFSIVLSHLLNLLHQMAVIQVASDIIDDSRLHQLAKKISPEDVQLFYQIALMGQKDLPYAPSPQIGFEMTLLRMLAFFPDTVSSSSPSSSSSSSSPSKSASETKWHEILPHLQLTGTALALAQQCSLKKLNELELQLILNPKQKLLLQKKQAQRISEAINHYFKCTMKLTIDLGEHQEDPPALLSLQHHQSRQQAAETAIIQDEKVKRIMEVFDATLIKESIVPH